MLSPKIASGVVHNVPDDLRKALRADPGALAAWNGLTPLARNEWICWVMSRKQKRVRNTSSVSVRNSTSQALDRFVSPDAPWRGSFRRIPTDIDDKTRKVQYAYDEAEAAATGGYDSQGRIADPSMFERIAQEEH